MARNTMEELGRALPRLYTGESFSDQSKEYDAFCDTEYLDNGDMRVTVTSRFEPVLMLQLRWRFPVPEQAKFLGDAFERTYGDTGWRNMEPERLMPWYFLMDDGKTVTAMGVRVRGGAFAYWRADPKGISLYLDLRNGASGVLPNGRTIHAADVVRRVYPAETGAFRAAQRFCRVLCKDPLTVPEPVYGANNWYYAYGNSTRDSILRDAQLISDLADGETNRPFMVIDAGWQPEYDEKNRYNGGPWRSGNAHHGDMAALAQGIASRGAKPGIWFRPLCNRDPKIPQQWRAKRDPLYLDPSRPEVLEYVKDDVRHLSGCGYRLLKHDFTTYDALGQWGFEMAPPLPVFRQNWHFADRSRTSAEIFGELYQAIHDAADESGTLILGCNTIGHLSAGLVHLSRIGDDTSGKEWARTLRMGVNTLAFRLPQHKAFYAADADCAGLTGKIDWKLNKEWLKLLGLSGTPLFVSIEREALKPEHCHSIIKALHAAARQDHRAEPLDWQTTLCPARWKINGTEKHFDWYPDDGLEVL